jgi:pectate lyase
MTSPSDLKESVPPGQQPEGPEGPGGPGKPGGGERRPPDRRLAVLLLVLLGAVVLAAYLAFGRDSGAPSDPTTGGDDTTDTQQDTDAEGGGQDADEPAPAELAPYAVAYTESDNPDERELQELDGASLDSPLNLYLDIPEDEAGDLERVELRSGDDLLWEQVSWPFGDKDPVQLEAGDHTVHAVLTYADGTTMRTPEATFIVDNGSTAVEDQPTVTPDTPLEPLGQAIGFGRAATGGAGGEVRWVTTTEDSGPGSLRELATGDEPKWIRFAQGGTIEVDNPIKIGSNTSIDGRDADVTISGAGLELDDVENVIVTDMVFKHGTGNDFTDALQIINGTHDVWIDHNTFADYPDGLVDITRGSTDVTVSYNDFSDHVKVMLINGGMDSSEDRPPEEPVRVTVHHNLFDGTFVRNPKARWAEVHLFNNYFRDWGQDGRGVAVQADTDAEIYSESNVFDAGENNRDAMSSSAEAEPRGRISSTGDLLEGGAQIQEYHSDQVFSPYEYYDASPEEASQQLTDEILAEAGVR